jgi:DNA ligase (NAD+)
MRRYAKAKFTAERKQLEELRRKLTRYNDAYYNRGVSLVSDEEYDILYRQLAALELKLAEHSSAPLSERVGAPVANSRRVAHQRAMLSLNNTYTLDELRKFEVRVENSSSNVHEKSFVVESKYDGVAVSLHYANGLLKQALTRGDGVYGEDITECVLSSVVNIPRRVKQTNEFELRGELIMSRDDFRTMNSSSDYQFSSIRNFVSGFIGRVHSAPVRLHIIAYSLIDSSKQWSTHAQQLDYVESLGFTADSKRIVCATIADVAARIATFEVERKALPFDTDGVVVKADSLALQREMGETSRAPRWAIAFKYSAVTAQTRLKEVVLQVGKSGRITPVALFDPVTLGGARISKATLNNIDFTNQLGVHANCTLVIARGGEVIPKVVDVLDPSSEPFFVEPLSCGCDHKSTLERVGRLHFCTRPNCESAFVGRLVHFTSKPALNVTNLGPEAIRQFVSLGIIKDEADFARLADPAVVQGIDGWGHVSAENLAHSITVAIKSLTLDRLLYALSIPHVGTETARALASHFPNLHDIETATPEQLQVAGIGDVAADAVASWFQNEKSKELLKRLRDAGVCPSKPIKIASKAPSSTVSTESVLTGKAVVITGTIDGMTREEAEAHARRLGAKVRTAVSKATDILIVGHEAGPAKLEKARLWSIEQLSAADFIKLVLA